MPIHEEALESALRICRARGGWTFRVSEVVLALPHLNQNSLKTHIVSRCCVNAPKHHQHRWDYFKRVARGVYEIQPRYRRRRAAIHGPTAEKEGRIGRAVSETRAAYTTERRMPLRETVHAVVQRGEKMFVAGCLEIAAVTQGRSLDEVVSNLEEAVKLYIEGEDLVSLGLSRKLRLSVTFELPVGPDTGKA